MLVPLVPWTSQQLVSTLQGWRIRDFIIDKYDSHLSLDNLLSKIKKGKEDPYHILNSYAAYVRNSNVSTLTLKQRVVTVKNFFEFCDIDISPRRFKLKVKLPKVGLKLISDSIHFFGLISGILFLFSCHIWMDYA